ncbi:MAG: AMP-binding protein [Actinoallomurus sp.]
MTEPLIEPTPTPAPGPVRGAREAPHAAYRRGGWWRDRTFLHDLRDGVLAHPAKPAVIARDVGQGTTRVLDYAELAALTDRCAGALMALGVLPGDVVAVQLSNRWELAPLVLGCIRAGVRLCPLVPEYRGRELEHMLRLTGARLLITMPGWKGVPLAEIGLRLAAELPCLDHVVVAGTPDEAPPAGALDFTAAFFGTAWEERHRPEHELGPDEPFLILFTSGTTGEPKGALHTQNTLYAPIRAEAEVFGLGADLVMSVASIYTHYSGLVQGMLMPLMLGGTMAFQDTWTGPELLALIDTHGVTFLYSTPTYVLDLLEARCARPRRQVTSLRHVVTGSAPVPPHLVEEIREAFGIRLYALWGMTENGPVTMTRPGDPHDWAAHSDGRPIEGMQVRIDPIPGRGEADGGRLWVRGPTQCLGYYRREELYATYLDEGGWFNTGDLARSDGNGGIRITGREKDLVMRRGFPIPVTEVEAVLARHPRIREVAVIGVADADGDETVCAVITTASGEPPLLAELRHYLERAGMTEWFWPERLELTDTLPKTITGKIRKAELQERYAPTPQD